MSLEEEANRVAKELRDMVGARGDYKRFVYISPRIKRVWSRAADVIEALIKSRGQV